MITKKVYALAHFSVNCNEDRSINHVWEKEVSLPE